MRSEMVHFCGLLKDYSSRQRCYLPFCFYKKNRLIQSAPSCKHILYERQGQLNEPDNLKDGDLGVLSYPVLVRLNSFMLVVVFPTLLKLNTPLPKVMNSPRHSVHSGKAAECYHVVMYCGGQLLQFCKTCENWELEWVTSELCCLAPNYNLGMVYNTIKN